MDPNEMLERIERLIGQYRTVANVGNYSMAASFGEEIVSDFEDLNAYLSDGGSLPAAWMPGDGH